MKLDFWRFPSISCQARHWWVTLSRFAFPLGCVSFLVWATSQKCERSSSTSNPLTPDSSTSGAVTLISLGQTSIMFSLFPPMTLVSTVVAAALCAFCSGEPLLSPCPAPKPQLEQKAAQPRGHFPPLIPNLFIFLSVIHWQEEGQTEMGFYVT